MANYAFSMNEENDDNTHVIHSVTFKTDYLDKLVEEFFWFLQRSGFNYVKAVTVDKGVGSVEFPCEDQVKF